MLCCLFIVALICLGCVIPQPRTTNLGSGDSGGSGEVLPKLGARFGTLVTVEGTVFPGADLRMKALESVLMLEVTSVNDKRLNSSVTLELRTLAGRDVRGGAVRLVGFESGGFGGIPSEAWNFTPPMATTEFSFRHHFVVVKQLPPRPPAGSYIQ